MIIQCLFLIFPQAIPRLKKLQELHLWRCYAFDTPILKCLLEHKNVSNNLTVLSFCAYSYVDFREHEEFFRNLSNLETLELYSEEVLFDKALTSIGTYCKKLTKVTIEGQYLMNFSKLKICNK